MKLPRSKIRRGRVEIIPMIDTILILLIFYMSFSTFKIKEKSMEAKLPIVSTRVSPTKVALDVTLHVKDRTHIVVNEGAIYDAISLRDVMGQLGMIGQEVTVIINADPETDYQAVIAALDACAQANLKKVAFRPLPDKITPKP
jgi:biopolymer transport protein ExbD